MRINIAGRILAVTVSMAALLIFFLPAAHALTIPGEPVMMVDGDSDSDTTVTVMNGYSGLDTSAYTLGYFNLTADPLTFLTISGMPVLRGIFDGGDIIDYAIYDGARYYTLSGDKDDDSYSTTMTFSNNVTTGSAQVPRNGWSSYPDYFKAFSIVWNIGDVIESRGLAMDFTGNNDGLAPAYDEYIEDGNSEDGTVGVPEPSTVTLLGFGLLAIFWVASQRGLTYRS